MAPTKGANKTGGTVTKELAKLSVPFGIVLAQKGLLNYLDSQKAAAKKGAKKAKSGGAAKHFEPSPLVGGAKKTAAPKKAAPKKPPSK